MNDALAGTAYAMLGQGIRDLLLEEFGEKMTPDESAVVVLVEHANWRKVADSMRPHNFQGAMVISQNVIGDLADVERQLEDETMVLMVPVEEEQIFLAAPEEEAEVPAAAPQEEQETATSMPEKLVIPIPKGLKYIEGIGDTYREKLRGSGIRNVDDLLDRGCSRRGREELAIATGISDKLLLRWINQADLYRIRGIGKEYAELLEAAGVDTVPELAQRVPANLLGAMGTANEQRKMVRRLPALIQVERWVTQARELPRRIEY
jgi:predicted flap endonuclease-1-like 5' DNA nuclease